MAQFREMTMDLPTTDRMDAHRLAAQAIQKEWPNALVGFVRYVGELASGQHRWSVYWETYRWGEELSAGRSE